MAEREQIYITPPKLANPGTLGLGGFALTTFVFNVHNAGLAIRLRRVADMRTGHGGAILKICAAPASPRSCSPETLPRCIRARRNRGRGRKTD